MATVIRLTRKGKHKKPFYRVVATDSRNPRDGRFLDILGTYDPLTEPVTIRIDEAKALQWLQRGARVSDTVKSLFQRMGILKQADTIRKN
ncbi:MAG: 30S ribosomal protein S16 [Nitrospirae bacterium]|nr:30S ribosomal protein S16 [Nitrospirota bacterium]